MAAISSAGQQPSSRIKGKRVNDVLVRAPQARRRAIRRYAINVGTITAHPARKRKRCGHDRSGWRRGNRHSRNLLRSRDWRGRRHRQQCRHSSGRTAASLFLANCRGIDIPRTIQRKRGYFFFWRAIQYKALARWRNSIDETAAVGAGDEIALRVHRQDANMSFIARKEYRVLSLRRYSKDFSSIAGSDVQVPRFIQSQIPDVLCIGFKIDSRTPGGIRAFSRGLFACLRLCRGCLLSPFVFNLIDLTVGRRGRKNSASRPDAQCLHLQFLGFENRRRLPVGGNAVNARRRSSGNVNHPRVVRRNGPDIRGGRRVGALKSWGKLESACIANGNAGRCPFDQVLELGLLPRTCAFSHRGNGEGKDGEKEKKGSDARKFHRSMVESGKV